MQTVTRKVPGGKLVRLKATVNDGKIVAPQISGDFFLTPPEKITMLEDALEGFPLERAEELQEVLSYVIEREGIDIQGFTVEDISLLVKELQ